MKDLKPFQMSRVTYYIHFVQVTVVLKVLLVHFLINSFLQFILLNGTLMQNKLGAKCEE